MEKYRIRIGITALADNELKKSDQRDELISAVNNDRSLAFEYEVQKIISRNLRAGFIKHPVPFNLRKKLLSLLR